MRSAAPLHSKNVIAWVVMVLPRNPLCYYANLRLKFPFLFIDRLGEVLSLDTIGLVGACAECSTFVSFSYARHYCMGLAILVDLLILSMPLPAYGYYPPI